MPARDASTRRVLRPVLGAVLAVTAACSQTETRALQHGSELPQSLEVEGDWDDIPAVVAGIIPRVELVADPPTIHDEHTFRCRVHSSRYGPGWLQFNRLDAGSIRIDARIGRFPHPVEEHWVEEALANRFSQIRGDTAAPIRVSPRPH